jgi:hypothetical protein
MISYAKTFERNYLFKPVMRSSQGKALSRLRSVRDAPYKQLDVSPPLPSVSEWKQNAMQIALPTEILMTKQPLEMARREKSKSTY